VLYGACRAGPALLGDRAAEAVADISRRLAAELVIRDGVDRRLHLLHAAQGRAVGKQCRWKTAAGFTPSGGA
jgi:hypothetical protein